jgi:hypothetical protein
VKLLAQLRVASKIVDRCAAQVCLRFVDVPNGTEASTITVNAQTRSLFGRTVGTVGVITQYKGEIWGSDGSDY